MRSRAACRHRLQLLGNCSCVALDGCSRRLFPTPLYRIHPWMRTSCIRAVVLRCRHTGHPWHCLQLLGRRAFDHRSNPQGSLVDCWCGSALCADIIHSIACNCSATAPALLSTAVPDAVLPHPSMDAYLLHPCSRPALSAYRPSLAIKKPQRGLRFLLATRPSNARQSSHQCAQAQGPPLLNSRSWVLVSLRISSSSR